MRNFAYFRAATLEDAVAASASGATLLAGGTELLNWLRLGIVDVDRIADVGRLVALRDIAREGADIRLGALATLNEIGLNAAVVESLPVLAQACLKAASAQLRNLATIGGNLLQKTRCPYFRAEAPGSKEMPWPCNKRVAESGCAAKDSGYTRLALFGATDACVATYPSDPAVALTALDAVVELRGSGGTRTMPVREFLLTQEEARDLGATRLGSLVALENRLEAGEVIVAFRVPVDEGSRHSAYVKVRERESYEYALVSAAAAVDPDGDRIRTARIALGSVAQRPWRLAKAERALAGRRLEAEAIGQALDEDLADARPLPGNEFKVRLARNTALRALRAAAGVAC
jgi:xanthine dehydrogenase YagS FAD-binding subunit